MSSTTNNITILTSLELSFSMIKDKKIRSRIMDAYAFIYFQQYGKVLSPEDCKKKIEKNKFKEV